MAGHRIVFAKINESRDEKLAGAALLAFGVPRLRITGRALVAGRRLAATSGRKNVAAVLGDAQRLADSMANMSMAGEKTARRVKAIDSIVSSIPESARAQAAVAAGAALYTAPNRQARAYERKTGATVTGW